jgi:adenine/guanine phosphoribosyltransferase-like PRPP-binding protein
VESIVGPTRARHQRLLRRSGSEIPAHTFDARKYEVQRSLAGEAVLLIDDTWTTGASAQSAAAVLRRAGAGPIAAVVIGRYLNPEWRTNDRRLGRIRQPFDWSCCSWHHEAPADAASVS